MAWTFKREESMVGDYKPIPEGDHRVRIASADRAVSKNTENPHEMLVLKLEVSGSNNYLFYNLVFLEDRPEITNRNLTAIFDSFKDIKMGDLNEKNWIGKVGAVRVKHEEYPAGSGKVQSKIHYFIKADKQGDLPPWKEPDRNNNNENVSAPAADDGFQTAMSGEVPFF